MSCEVYLEIVTVIIFAVMFEISPGAVITQSELHYVIPGAKAFKSNYFAERHVLVFF